MKNESDEKIQKLTKELKDSQEKFLKANNELEELKT